jgi:D-beta-D-heptose 7-phosphate kinase/D-beta-D-heptose 1-phosphate adenosyltransferase
MSGESGLIMKDLNNIEKKNILVVGDVMIDTYYTGDIKRISPEAPVPVFRKKTERSVLGGAANVAANLVAAGQNVSVMAMVGNDENGDKLRGIFNSQGINTDLVISLDRSTTEKVRFLANNNQQVLRLDIEDTDPMNEADCDLLLKKVEEVVKKFDLILLSDYLKGLLTERFTQGVLKMARENNILAVIDVKDPNVEKYKNAYLIKPNLKELQDLTKRTVKTDEEIIEASNQLRRTCQCDYILTTCGSRGMVLVGDNEPYFIQAENREVFDVSGAGDTTIAYLAACMVNGFSMKESVEMANLAASIQVSKVGTSSVYWREIREYLSDQKKGFIHKLISGKLVDDFREENADKKIVFTNGCFDIMHVGHLRYLQEASKLGDILIVALNSDLSVKRLKGPERPINSELERAEMMCALGFVDYVVIFEEDTPLELIKKIQPDVLVKGGDYTNDYVVGTREVEAGGGKLVLIPFVEGKSTTNIIKKMQS